jgi:hypothetical protein
MADKATAIKALHKQVAVVVVLEKQAILTPLNQVTVALD